MKNFVCLLKRLVSINFDEWREVMGPFNTPHMHQEWYQFRDDPVGYFLLSGIDRQDALWWLIENKEKDEWRAAVKRLANRQEAGA